MGATKRYLCEVLLGEYSEVSVRRVSTGLPGESFRGTFNTKTKITTNRKLGLYKKFITFQGLKGEVEE